MAKKTNNVIIGKRSRLLLIYTSILLSLVGSLSCLKLDPSPLNPYMGLLASVDTTTTFHAYPTLTKAFYSYSTSDATWKITTYTGVSGFLQDVVKTTDRFVAVDDATSSIYTSTDGVAWTASSAYSTFPGDNGTGKVAACGNNVVVAFVDNSNIDVSFVKSSDGGASFSSANLSTFGFSTATIRDLICKDGIFHISVSGSPPDTYLYSVDFGSTWNAPATNPNGSGIELRGLAVNGQSIQGFFQSTFPTLSTSSDAGKNWTASATTISGTYSYAITYVTGAFYAPYISGADCIMNKSLDNGTTWDASTVLTSCATSGQIWNIKGNASTIVAVGQQGATLPFAIISTDAGATWSIVSLPVGGSGTLRELIMF